MQLSFVFAEKSLSIINCQLSIDHMLLAAVQIDTSFCWFAIQPDTIQRVPGIVGHGVRSNQVLDTRGSCIFIHKYPVKGTGIAADTAFRQGQIGLTCSQSATSGSIPTQIDGLLFYPKSVVRPNSL